MRKRASRFEQLALPHTAGVLTGASALSRATARAKSKHEAPAPLPWRCVVLGVDTARHAGWAIACAGLGVTHSGELDTLGDGAVSEIAAIVARALALADDTGVPCVMVLESPWGGSVAVISALGAARERWGSAWRAAKQSAARVVLVTPGTWRAAVLGARAIGLPRDEVRALEKRAAGAMVLYARPVGDDEAPAMLIARWGAQSAAVGKVIGKRAVRASVKEWTGKR